jgi:hypothetical protein
LKKKHCRHYHIPLLNIICVLRIFDVFKTHVKRYARIQKKTFQDLESMIKKAVKKKYLAVNMERAFMSTVNQNLVTIRDYFISQGFIDYGCDTMSCLLQDYKIEDCI